MEQWKKQGADALAQDMEKAQAQQLQSIRKDATQKKGFSFSFAESDEVEKELRKPRSKAYMEVISAIDVLSATDEEIIERLRENVDEDLIDEFADMSDEDLLEEIRATFREEFQSLPIEVTSILHGVLAKCYIGGCDCHAITSEGYILDHFNALGPMPENLAKGRKIYHQYPNCSCVEVYNNCCRVIMPDATVIKVDD